MYNVGFKKLPRSWKKFWLKYNNYKYDRLYRVISCVYMFEFKFILFYIYLTIIKSLYNYETHIYPVCLTPVVHHSTELESTLNEEGLLGLLLLTYES